MQTAMPQGSFDIVATLGPSSIDLATQLQKAGATAFRLNGSHLEIRELEQLLRTVRGVLEDFPIVVDLQGAKIRLGTFEPRLIRKGEILKFDLQPSEGALPLPHPELFAALRRHDTLSCDDGRVQLRIVKVVDASFEAESLTDGLLRPRKGVNLVEHPISLDCLSHQDRAQVEVCSRFSNVHFAFSFMDDGREVGWLKALCPDRDVIGKVERQEALTNFESIAERADLIWICRGDLGAQLGFVEMARWVCGLNPHSVKRPIIMAGQVLEHMTQHNEPTRSEVCHLHDLMLRGYAGIVLSDETAIGKDPLNVVNFARSLASGFGH